MTSLAENTAQRNGLDVDQSFRFPEVKATSLRGPCKGEIRKLAVTTSSVLHHVPNGVADERGTPQWNGRIVRMRAIGGDVYIAFSADGAVTVDEAAVSVQTGSVAYDGVTATRVTGHASNQEAWHILETDGWVDVDVRPDWIAFAVKGSASCNLLTHPSES